jgi:hypothetical protein
LPQWCIPWPLFQLDKSHLCLSGKIEKCHWVGHESKRTRCKLNIIILECTRLECWSQTAISWWFLPCGTVPTE